MRNAAGTDRLERDSIGAKGHGRSVIRPRGLDHSCANAQLHSPGRCSASRDARYGALKGGSGAVIRMSNEERDPIYVRYRDFLDADPRRRGDALELGIDWCDGQHYHRACWYQATGELTLERLSTSEAPSAEDFYRGVSGPVEVLRRISTQEQLAGLLGTWPNIAPGEPRTTQRLRSLVGRDETPAT